MISNLLGPVVTALWTWRHLLAEWPSGAREGFYFHERAQRPLTFLHICRPVVLEPVLGRKYPVLPGLPEGPGHPGGRRDAESLGSFFAAPVGASFWDEGQGSYLRIPSRSSRSLDGGWEKRYTGDPSTLASSPPGETRRASPPLPPYLFLPPLPTSPPLSSPLPISLFPSPLPCHAGL